MKKLHLSRSGFLLFWLAVCIAAAIASKARAEHVQLVEVSEPTGSHNIDYVSNFGGSVHAVYVEDGYTYVGGQMGLVQLDTSEPARPVLVNHALQMQPIGDVVVTQGRAYAMDMDGWLHVVDVSNPHELKPLGSLKGVEGKIYVANEIVYVATVKEGLWMVDVSNPAELQEVGWYKSSYEMYSVFVVDQTAYVAAGYDGMHIIDVSDPNLPVELGVYEAQSAYGEDVAVRDSIAYVAYVASRSDSVGRIVGLQVVDVSQSAHPSSLGAYEVEIDEFGYVKTELMVTGDSAYLSNSIAGLRIVDVSDPQHPAEKGTFDTGGMSTESLFVADHTAHLVLDRSLVKMVDVTDQSKPVGIGIYDPPDFIWSVHVSGDFAYCAASGEGLRVIDVSDPYMPIEVGAYPDPVYDVFVEDDVAYLATGNGLQTVDVTDPTNPKALGQKTLPGEPGAVVVVDDLAYVSYMRVEWVDPLLDFYIGLAIVDISNPAEPEDPVIFEHPLGPAEVTATNIYVLEDIAALTYQSHFENLLILDVSNSANPMLLGRYDYGGAYASLGVFVRDDTAYATASDGLHIVDITEATAPTLMNVFPSKDWAKDVYISGNEAFLLTGMGLQVIEIADPRHPRELGHYDLPIHGSGGTVFAIDDIAYVAGWSSGLVIVRYTPNYPQWLPMVSG